MPVPQGQSFRIEADNPALAGGIEFGQYAGLVAGELTRYGYRPAAPGEKADLVVGMSYGVDNGKERIRSSPVSPTPGTAAITGVAFIDRWLSRVPHGRRYLYGWSDPFLWGGYGGGFGGYNDVESYTVYTSGLDLKIDRAADGTRLFEGHASARSRDNDLQALVPNLVEAMFTGFPGNSGERVKITVAPPSK